jgi:DNA polymerase-1
VRSVLIPEPGNAFIVGDYANIEVYMLAHMIADPGLIADIEAGMDLYARTAALVYGKPYADCGKGGKYADLRQLSKTTTLTAMYGGGARLLGTRLGVSTAEAAHIKSETLAAIPGYFDFDDRVKRAVLRRPFPHVVTLLGRRLFVPREKPYVALNTVIQGNAAEIMKLGLIAAAPAIKPFGYRPLLVVHDELLAEGPVAHAQEALLVLKKAMESVYPLRPRLKVSGDWSTDSYGACK